MLARSQTMLTTERRPLAAIALTTDTSAMTAIANDYGYEHVFSRQLEGLGAPGDVLVAITTSGRSDSVRRAVASAQGLGMTVIGMTGALGADFMDMGFRVAAAGDDDGSALRDLQRAGDFRGGVRVLAIERDDGDRAGGGGCRFGDWGFLGHEQPCPSQKRD